MSRARTAVARTSHAHRDTDSRDSSAGAVCHVLVVAQAETAALAPLVTCLWSLKPRQQRWRRVSRACGGSSRDSSAGAACHVLVVTQVETAALAPRVMYQQRPGRVTRDSNFRRTPTFRVTGYFLYMYPQNHCNVMAHSSCWLRCENLMCGPRFDSGTCWIIVVDCVF